MGRRIDDDIKGSIDWITFSLYLIMVLAGWLSIYAASYQYNQEIGLFDLSGRAGMQLVWIGTSLTIGFVLLKLDSNLYDVFAYLIYGACIALLIITVIVAPDIKGSRSWIVITDSIRIQPAEFAKFATALALARLMSGYNFKLMTYKNLILVTTIIFLPILLILLQQETGSALVYFALILMLYREGLPGIVLFSAFFSIVLFVVGLKYSEVDMGLLSQGEFLSAIMITLVSAGLTVSYRREWSTAMNILLGMVVLFGGAFILFHFGVPANWGIVALIGLVGTVVYLIIRARSLWSKTYMLIAMFAILCLGFVHSIDYVFTEVLQPHQQNRIMVSFGMKDDPRGAGYNVAQSKIAVGSGGFIGKGFLNGTQTKLKYVPEQDTDFIYCTIGEEHGFVGSVGVLLVYLVFILRLVYLSERQKDTFGRVFGYCVASIFFFHMFVNVGMVIGLVPVIGIPLPFFSYGGSSLWGFTILLFIFLRLDMSRKRR